MSVSFKEAEDADACIAALNGRWFAKKRVSAETWDGRTKYEVQESEAERDARLNKWEKFLESDEKKKDGESATKTASADTECNREEDTTAKQNKMDTEVTLAASETSGDPTSSTDSDLVSLGGASGEGQMASGGAHIGVQQTQGGANDRGHSDSRNITWHLLVVFLVVSKWYFLYYSIKIKNDEFKLDFCFLK